MWCGGAVGAGLQISEMLPVYGRLGLLIGLFLMISGGRLEICFLFLRMYYVARLSALTAVFKHEHFLTSEWTTQEQKHTYHLVHRIVAGLRLVPWSAFLNLLTVL